MATGTVKGVKGLEDFDLSKYVGSKPVSEMSTKELAVSLGLPAKKAEKLDGSRKANLSPVEGNRVAFDQACADIGSTPKVLFAKLVDLLHSQQAGKVVHPVPKVIRELVTVQGDDGQLTTVKGDDGEPLYREVIVQGGVELPAMVPKDNTRMQAAQLLIRLLGYDPGVNLNVHTDEEGTPGDVYIQNNMTIVSEKLVSELEEARATGRYDRVRELYMERIQAKATGNIKAQNAKESAEIQKQIKGKANIPTPAIDAEFTITTGNGGHGK